MDANFKMQLACHWSLALVLSLGQTSLATADESAAADVVFASDADETSTIFITDDTPSEPPALPAAAASAAADGSIVFVEDVPAAGTPAVQRPPAATAAATLAPIAPAVRGDLTVVANQSQPTANLRPTGQLPVAPPSTIEALPTVVPVAAPAVRDQPGDVQVAVHAEPTLGPANPTTTQPTSPDVRLINAHQLSLKATTAGQYTNIIEACTTAIREGVEGDKHDFARQLASWALNRRGQRRVDSGESDLAKADFQAALDYNKRNWRALHNRGVSFAQAGGFAEAFDDFSATIEVNPKYAKAYANRATLYVQAKDLQAAIKDYEQAIELDSQFATAHVGLGRVSHMLGRWDDAIENFSKAIEIEPTSPDVVCSRGDLHADMGHYAEALADYARTIELDSEFAHAYRNGAWLLATCPDEAFRDPENAVLGAQQALEFSYGERHVALDTLAAAYASNDQFDEAVVTITQAVDLAPEGAKFTYLSRLQLYQDNQPFRTEPVGDVSQVTYEASDQ